MQIGYFPSCEEYSPKEILDQARLAEQARACAICELSAHDPASP
ncbi:MAG: hypothetical protein QOE97_1948 [Pseudonocardiales bacterium]|nr:hypothetical protein [Pseudonocardiales bacterium]